MTKPRYYAHTQYDNTGAHPFRAIKPQGYVPTVIDRETGGTVIHAATPRLAQLTAQALSDHDAQKSPEAIAERIVDGLDFGDDITPGPEAITDALRSGWFNGWDVLRWIERAVQEARA